MKKLASFFALAAISTVLGSTSVSAQQMQSGYFLDNYVYSYRINPSLLSEKGFFALAVGNISADLNSTVGVSNFLFPNAKGDGLVTGLHPSVSTEQFVGNLPDAMGLGVGLNMNLLSIGVRKPKSLTTVEINLRSDIGFALPGQLFAFVKSGSGAEGVYDLSNLNVHANALTELAIGRGRSLLNDHLVIGYRVKLLAGLANANAGFNTATLQVNSSGVAVNAEAQAQVSVNGVDFTKVSTSEGNDYSKIAFDYTKITPAGYGAAVDLGVTGKFFNNCLTVSAGITDLGAVQWTYTAIGKSSGSTGFYGFDEIGLDTDFNSLGDQFKTMGDDLMKFADVKFETAQVKTTEMLPFTANASVRYRVPFLRAISVGAIGSYHSVVGGEAWTDARAGVTFTPFTWLSLTGNYGVSTFGKVGGGALSVTLLGINVFAGLDCYADKVGLIPISGVNVPVFGGVPFPINSFRYSLNLGVTFQMLGHRYTDRKKPKK